MLLGFLQQTGSRNHWKWQECWEFTHCESWHSLEKPFSTGSYMEVFTEKQLAKEVLTQVMLIKSLYYWPLNQLQTELGLLQYLWKKIKVGALFLLTLFLFVTHELVVFVCLFFSKWWSFLIWEVSCCCCTPLSFKIIGWFLNVVLHCCKNIVYIMWYFRKWWNLENLHLTS